LFLLADKKSTSGTEILIAAFKEFNKAIVIGDITGGNDSIAIARDLPDGSAIAITTARFLTSKGKPFNKVGIEPDYKVSLSEQDIKNKKDAWFYHANLFSSPQTDLSKDVQLMKVKELALQKSSNQTNFRN
jgi:C-terminal processing protease CtpA/Prc